MDFKLFIEITRAFGHAIRLRTALPIRSNMERIDAYDAYELGAYSHSVSRSIKVVF